MAGERFTLLLLGHDVTFLMLKTLFNTFSPQNLLVSAFPHRWCGEDFSLQVLCRDLIREKDENVTLAIRTHSRIALD